jgi:hypothetical protein
MMMMNSVSRLQKYSALAAAPGAALGGLAVGGISVEATAGGVQTVTAAPGASSSRQLVFTAGGFDFYIRAGFFSSSSTYMGLSINNKTDAGPMKFWSGGTQSKVISAGATGAGLTNSGWGGASNSTGGNTWANFNLLGTGDTGSNRYLGFFVQNTVTTDYVAGWINFDFDRSAGQRVFTINNQSLDVGANASITMPANGGAVPGIGGLAGLAMGAAGLRRKRQRVA